MYKTCRTCDEVIALAEGVFVSYECQFDGKKIENMDKLGCKRWRKAE